MVPGGSLSPTTEGGSRSPTQKDTPPSTSSTLAAGRDLFSDYVRPALRDFRAEIYGASTPDERTGRLLAAVEVVAFGRSMSGRESAFYQWMGLRRQGLLCSHRIGPGDYRELADLVPFSRWLQSAGFDFVQFLPLNEMQEGQSSPYSALSAMAIDPIFIGAQIITALQGIVSRNTDPIESLVVSITKFHAGDAMNVIPPTAELAGTVRVPSSAELRAASATHAYGIITVDDEPILARYRIAR